MTGKRHVTEAMLESPVIPAVKDFEGLKRALESESRVIFTLFGDILTIGSIVDEILESGRLAVVHADLVAGLSAKEIAVDFLHRARASGIISTKSALIRRANELGLFSVQRIFLLDSLALSTTHKQLAASEPDVIEILPGAVFKAIRALCSSTRVPVIAGGLIADKEDVVSALKSGAAAVSSSNPALWFV